MALPRPHGLLCKRSKTQLPNCIPNVYYYLFSCSLTCDLEYTLAEALGTSCHHIRIAYAVFFCEGALIHAILLLNAEKASVKW